MKNSSITRKDFIRNSTMGIAGVAIGSGMLNSASASAWNSPKSNHWGKSFTIKNVRLETGFNYEGEEVVGTQTDLFCLDISNGKINNIYINNPDAKAMDAKGFLLLPAFKDMHIHLDKTFYGDKWQAIKRRNGGVKGMIALEQKILPEMLKTSTFKAEKIIELLQSKGTSFARSHVNIEPTSGLQSLKNLQLALENKKAGFGAELVAFPQHGVYYTESVPYLKEAAKMNIDFIGGLDPFTIDGAIEKTIDFTVQLALDHNKGIDIHLHESGVSGIDTIQYLMKKVIENKALQGKTFVSHAFALARLDDSKQQEMAEMLANVRIGIISTIPFAGMVMPIPTLLKYGVKVMTGNDSIVDHWNTFGTGSVLYKANLAAQLYGQSSELGLSRMLGLATAGVIPLDEKGKQQWPRAGDVANLVLVDASCSAEAVSRMSPVKSLIHEGNMVY